jgi:DNA replication and repair protein RecF
VRIDALQLRGVRNLRPASLPLGPRFTVLSGPNGAGKTSVLEALYLVSTLRSFRTHDLHAMLQRPDPAVQHSDAPPAAPEPAQIDVIAFDPELAFTTRLTVKLEPRGGTLRRTASLDGKVVRAASQFYGRIGAVLFTPEDLGVLRGSPTGRRQLLDRMLFARAREHISDIQAYERVLRARNRVLKDVGIHGRATLLDTYDEQLVAVGARVWLRRSAIVRELAPDFAAAFQEIHGVSVDARAGYVVHAMAVTGTLRDERAADSALAAATVTHLPPAALELAAQQLLTALQARRGLDEQRGTTSVGPHRDDLDVRLGERSAADFASQGQARALMLALKIAELRAAGRARGAAPLLLLDDVSSELDPERNAALFAALGQHTGQCVLTTTDDSFIRLPPDARRTRVQVRDGVLELTEKPS